MFVSIKPCYALRIQRFRGNACHSANSADYFVEVACKTQNRCHIKDSFKTDGRNASCGMRSRRMPRTSLVSWTSDAGLASGTQAFGSPDACLFCYRRNSIRITMTITMTAIRMRIWFSPPCPKGGAARLRPVTHSALCRQRS